MNPEQFMKYTQRLDMNGLAICDGISEPLHSSVFDVFYPFFILSGLGFFIWILLKWESIKEKIYKKQEE